jgi:histidinol dehydrogenase
MLRELRYTGPADWPDIHDWLLDRTEQGGQASRQTNATVAAILDDVARDGDKALVDYTRRFDCKEFSADMLQVPPEDIEAALQAVPEDDLSILAEATENVFNFHEAQVQQSWMRHEPDGTVLGQLMRPVGRVGLYVPGGRGGDTPLISSLIMNAVPALVAGVESVAVASPPTAEGGLNPYLLATAALLGIEEVYRTGSAWAVAGLAFGTETIAPVDLITGPGNIFVTTAKRMLIGQVGIDMIAGPSEIVILADESARNQGNGPAWLAADLLSQAEHDPLASAILITDDPSLAQDVQREIKDQLAKLPRCDIAQQALQDWGAVIMVDDMEAGLELVNELAPEHLELVLADPWPTLGHVRNAGAVFLGLASSEPVGDYFAGPNHVLPTMGTARFSQALGVDTFVKKTSLIAASPRFITENKDKIARLARLEGLEAHARAVEMRNFDKP